MKQFLKYVKDNRICALVLALSILILIIVIPLLINYLFKQAPLNSFFAAEWTAGDALGYHGTTLSFLSTTLLSIMALWQNHIIEDKNNKHTALLEKMEKEKNAPRLIIENPTDFSDGCGISFMLRNISENIAHKIKVHEIHTTKQNFEKIWETDNVHEFKYLAPMAECEIKIPEVKIDAETSQIRFKITYYDKFDKAYENEVTGSKPCLNKPLSFEIKNI